MKNTKVVYHGSSMGGLERLEPFKAKHDKAYVYATDKYWVMLFFAAKGQGKFDGWIGYDWKGNPIFYETRPNSFQERYRGQKSFCYILPADSFSKATGDKTEVVSEKAVDVLSCEEIADVGAEFDKLVKDKKFRVVPYNTSKHNTEEKCNEYILKVLTDKGYFKGKDFRQKEWASEYYKDLIEEYYCAQNDGQ